MAERVFGLSEELDRDAVRYQDEQSSLEYGSQFDPQQLAQLVMAARAAQQARQSAGAEQQSPSGPAASATPAPPTVLGPTDPFAGGAGPQAFTPAPQPDPSKAAAILSARQAGVEEQANPQVIPLDANAPSRIPRPATAPDAEPSLSVGDPKQLRAPLGELMRGIRGPENPPLGVLPDGSLVRDVTYLAKAPSRIPRQYASGDYYSNVNTEWITTNEGGSLLNGYVPKVKGGGDNSGVTIAAGYDLGQHSPADLGRLGLSEDLIKRLSPYLGLTGQDARDALAKQSVRITRDEANQIDQGAFDSYFNSAAQAFDQAVGAGAFAKLPWRAQTVIADLWYNMGDLRGRKTKEGVEGGAPVFWGQVTTGDWEAAYRNLMNFTNKDRLLKDRAKKNAKLLRDAIDIGTLASE